MAFSERIRDALSAARRAAETAEGGRVRDCLGLLAMGRYWTAGTLAEAVGRCSGYADNRTVVLLTCATDVEAYQIDGVITEHIPAPTENTASLVYSGNKISSVIFKWRIADLRHLDNEGAELLERATLMGAVVLPNRA